jgi:hypothetical protein
VATYSSPGIFNVLDPWINPGSGYTGLLANDSTTATAQQNTTVLRGIIALANEACSQAGHLTYGATILFPGHSVVPTPIGGGGSDAGATYYFAKPNADTVTIPIYCNWPLRFLGTGSVTLSLAPDINGDFGDLFSIQTAATGLGENIGGITFEDLDMVCPQGATSAAGLCAVHTVPESPKGGGARSVRLVRCVLNEWPIGAWFEEALQPSMLQCTIEYSYNVGTGITFGDTSGASAKEAYVAGCLFEASNAGSTAISILACEHIRVSDCQIDGYLYGILIEPGSGGKNVVRCSFTNVTVYPGGTESTMGGGYTGTAGSAVIIQPQGGLAVGQVVFTSCFFEMGEQVAPTMVGLGSVVVDATNGTIDTIRFVSCYSARWPEPGLIVKGGATDVEVLGGMYAGNNYTGDLTVTQPYGIYIGEATNVRIVGASCIGEYNAIILDPPVTTSPQQAVGIYIDQGASNVIVDSCDLTENSANGIVVNGTSGAVTNIFLRSCNVVGYSSITTAIDVTGTGTNVSTVSITDCAGYNDQATSLTLAFGLGSAVFSSASLGYHGPVAFYISAAHVTEIQIKSVNTGLLTGTFMLPPGSVTLKITYSATPTVLALGM